MNPAACARAKKALRLERETALVVPTPDPLPLTPEGAARKAYRDYRRNSRPFRRAFRGIVTRREAERFLISRMRKTQRAIDAAKEMSS
jgi:hypothetical protein